MPATINVNYRTVVHRKSQGVSFSFPDVCKTPVPGGMVPIPYPNIGMSKDTVKGSATVSMDGVPIMLKGSVFATSYGDEPGVGGGVVSGVNKGRCEFLNYSFDVKVEGKNVPRLADPMGQNKGSPHNIVGPAEVQPPKVVPPVVAQAKKRKELSAKVIKVDMTDGRNVPLFDSKPDGSHEPVPAAGDVHWAITRKKSSPAAYVRDGAKGGNLGRKLKVTLEVITELSGKAVLEVRSRAFQIVGETNIKGAKAKQTIEVECEFKKLPRTVRLLENTPFHWKLKLAGQKRTLNATVQTLFILDEKPKTPSWPGGENQNWYPWVLKHSCFWADRKATEKPVFRAIWSRFSDGEKAIVPHDTKYEYWKTDNPVQKLCLAPHGATLQGWSCRAIAHFFLMSVAVHGMSARTIIPIDPRDLSFIVAIWTLAGKGGDPQNQISSASSSSGFWSTFVPSYSYSLKPGEYYGGEWTGFSQPKESKTTRAGWFKDAERLVPPHPGQGQSNPPLEFFNHWIIDMQSARPGLYDTSYGGGKAPLFVGPSGGMLANYQKNAISGWRISTPVGGDSLIMVKPNKFQMAFGGSDAHA